MKTINWKLLEPKDIEVRVGSFLGDNKEKVSLLLYQNARTAMDAFDEQFGEFNWKCDYKQVGDKIYGCIAVWDAEKNMFLEKWDTGEESNISADKGQASDIIKRCAVRWGYGRELYTAPKIKVDNDGYNCAGYKVGNIAYDENRRIIALEITDRWGNIKWTMNSQNKGNSSPSKNKVHPKMQELAKYMASVKSQHLNDKPYLEEIKGFWKHYETAVLSGNFKGDIIPDKLWKSWLNQKARYGKRAVAVA